MLIRAFSNDREQGTQKATSNLFAVALAHRYFRYYEFKMGISGSYQHELLFKQMPAFEDVLIAADLRLTKFRATLGKRRNAKAPRSKVFRIGPFASYGNVRLPRTVDGFIEEYARTQNGRVREVWDRLIVPLASIGSNIVCVKDSNIRRDYYRIEIEEHVRIIKYGHFERLFTRSRKPVKTIGELLAFRSS